ncbi:MAG: hypothetical protein WAU45_10690 [Blastocatellia bacterium]
MRRFTGGLPRVWLILPLVLFSTIAVAGSRSRSEPMYLAQVFAAQQIAPARAQVVLDTTRHDYGEVFAGEELDYPYNILNAGTAPLELVQRPLSARAAIPKVAPLAIRASRVADPSYKLVRAAARLAAPS